MRRPVALLCCALLAACGGPDQRVAARQAMVQGDADAARQALNDLYGHHRAEYGAETAELSQSRHLLLWHLERSAIELSIANATAALEHLVQASRLAREARTRSLARAASAAVINDNLTRWTGEAAEIVRIPAFGALAHLHLAQQAEGVVPGAARDAAAAALQSDRAASAALALQDHLERLGEGELGATTYRNDAWLWTLAALIRHCTAILPDDRSGARLCAERAEEAWTAEGTQPAVVATLLARARGEAPPAEHGTVVVLEDAGWAPLRQTLRIYIVTAAPPADTDHLDLGGVFIYIDGPGKEHLDPLHGLVLPGSLIRSLTRGQFGVFGCEIPVLPALARRPALGSLQSAAGTQPLQAVDDPGADVHRCFMDGQKRRVMAIIIRTAAKLIAARQGVKAVERSGSDEERAEREALADGLWLLLSGLITVSEQADTRCWSQLPGRVGAACVDLPVGTHTLTLRHASGAISTLGPIQVLPGRTIVVTTRSFPDGTAVPESRR